MCNFSANIHELTPLPFYSLPLLKNGATGVAVTNAQTLLISKGYPCGGRVTAGRETADGDFGPATE